MWLGYFALSAQFIAILLITRALTGYLRTGLVNQLPSLLVGTSLFVGGFIVAAIGYLLEQIRRVHVSSVRQAYFLNLRGSN